MAPVSTTALVLASHPFGETSTVLHLYTEALGLVHALAKGVRRAGRQFVPTERGLLIECRLYPPRTATLFTAGDISLLNGFCTIRHTLVAGALRDTAFEIALKTIHAQEPNPELFGFLCRFLERLDAAVPAGEGAVILWQYLGGFARLMGFGVSFGRCAQCRSPLQEQPAVLAVEKGSVLCGACAPDHAPHARLSGAVREFIRGRSGAAPHLKGDELVRITRLLTHYCLYHGHARTQCTSLDFLCRLLASG